MIPPMINPDDDDMKAQLLEQLMGEMDDRVGSQLPGKGPGVTIDISVTPKGDASMGDEDGGDDLGGDPSIGPDMADLIRRKRGGY
jgi:hypothetical protein